MTEAERGLTRGLCELTLESRDPHALAEFYEAVFGWPELSRDDDRVWLACGERSRLGLWTAGPETWDFFEQGQRAREGVDALGMTKEAA